jgi:hypothetical protein
MLVGRWGWGGVGVCVGGGGGGKFAVTGRSGCEWWDWGGGD